MPGSTRARSWLLLLLAGLFVCGVAHGDEPQGDDGVSLVPGRVPHSEQLQAFLDGAMQELLAGDAALRRQEVRVALMDLPAHGPPRRADWNGDSPVYPASVVKFVYLMAAFHWRDQGWLEIDSGLDRQLRAMTYSSSNRATQQVVYRLTETEPGPRLSPDEYRDFVERRHRIKRWLESLGVDGLHTVHPTYDGGADLHGRDVQFLEDPNIPGALPKTTPQFKNRQAMTANGTARLLMLLATDRALSPASSEEVRQRMRRDPRKQRYLAHRIAGGADGRRDLEVYSKTGTWGPIFADGGIVRHASGDQLVVVVFVEGKPAYRGPFIAQLTRRAVEHLLPPAGGV